MLLCFFSYQASRSEVWAQGFRRFAPSHSYFVLGPVYKWQGCGDRSCPVLFPVGSLKLCVSVCQQKRNYDNWRLSCCPWVWVGRGDLGSPFQPQLLNDSASLCLFPLFLLMAVLCFPQCHHSSSLPTRKHLKSPFILLIGFSMSENAFPSLIKSALQGPLEQNWVLVVPCTPCRRAIRGQEGLFLPLKFALPPASMFCKYLWCVSSFLCTFAAG